VSIRSKSSISEAMGVDAKRFAWGAGVRQRLRLAPLFLSLSIADRIAGALGTRNARLVLPPWRAGISIVIPERDSPQLLLKALASLYEALDAIDEPRQVVVVANGTAPGVYDEVVGKYPGLDWVHHRQPLGFSAAINKGLRRVRYDWTFLMNNDMTLDRSAVREVCALRSAEVFAIACQIHQQSPSGRREETGFTDWYVNTSGIQVFHADPGEEDRVRSHLCASGGAARPLTLNRAVSGTAGTLALTLNGTGTVDLAGGNTHNGTFLNGGTLVANTRHLTLVSVEELNEIASRLGVRHIDPAWMAANIATDGAGPITQLPPGTLLRASSGASIYIAELNSPCRVAARLIAEHVAYAGDASAFLCPRVFAGEAEASGLVAGAGEASAFFLWTFFAGEADASGLALGEIGLCAPTRETPARIIIDTSRARFVVMKAG
jgi:hypothetical protein